MDKVAKCFEDAWRYTVSRYDDYPLDESPYWYEEDILIPLGSFLEKRLREEHLFDRLRIHAGVKMNTNEWEDCKILQEKGKRYLETLKKWCKKEGRKEPKYSPRIDILVLDEDEVAKRHHSFDLAAELKLSSLDKTISRVHFCEDIWPSIRYDIFRLRMLRELEICRNAFFCYLDEHHAKEANAENRIKDEIADSGVKLCYTSHTLMPTNPH